MSYRAVPVGAIGHELASAIMACTMLAPAVAAAATDSHPSPYVDEGACPFECCTYGEWKVEHDTLLRSAPQHGAKAVGKVEHGDSVTTLDGKVVVVPGRFHVKRDHDEYHRGDTLWVYTYLGEGVFKVWHEGFMKEADLNFSPYGGTAGDRCQDSDEACWGELDAPLKMTWWIKLRNAHDIEGWSDEYEHFSGADACG